MCFVKDTILLLNFLSRITTSEKKKEQKSKYAEVAHYSADFSIAYLGLVVSLREIWRGCAISISRYGVASANGRELISNLKTTSI